MFSAGHSPAPTRIAIVLSGSKSGMGSPMFCHGICMGDLLFEDPGSIWVAQLYAYGAPVFGLDDHGFVTSSFMPKLDRLHDHEQRKGAGVDNLQDVAVDV